MTHRIYTRRLVVYCSIPENHLPLFQSELLALERGSAIAPAGAGNAIIVLAFLLTRETSSSTSRQHLSHDPADQSATRHGCVQAETHDRFERYGSRFPRLSADFVNVIALDPGSRKETTERYDRRGSALGCRLRKYTYTFVKENPRCLLGRGEKKKTKNWDGADALVVGNDVHSVCSKLFSKRRGTDGFSLVFSINDQQDTRRTIPTRTHLLRDSSVKDLLHACLLSFASHASLSQPIYLSVSVWLSTWHLSRKPSAYRCTQSFALL